MIDYISLLLHNLHLQTIYQIIMPRGYLKHNQGANTSKKQARGGSSRRKNKDTNNHKKNVAKPPDLHSRTQSSCHTTIIEDFALHPIASNQRKKKDITYPIAECSICFNSAPLISLSKKCWHEAACKQCLRKLYVTNTKPQSYLLECYHPCCSQTVQVAQLKKHNIFNSLRKCNITMNPSSSPRLGRVEGSFVQYIVTNAMPHEELGLTQPMMKITSMDVSIPIVLRNIQYLHSTLLFELLRTWELRGVRMTEQRIVQIVTFSSPREAVVIIWYVHIVIVILIGIR